MSRLNSDLMGVPGDAIDGNDQETVALALSAGGVVSLVIGGILGSRLLRIVGLGSAVAGSVLCARMKLAERSEKIEAAERTFARGPRRSRSGRPGSGPRGRRKVAAHLIPKGDGQVASPNRAQPRARGAGQSGAVQRNSELSVRLGHAVRTVGDGDATEDRHPLERQHWCVRIVLRGCSDIDSSGERLRLLSTLQPGGIWSATPPKRLCAVRRAPGASSASRRSSAMPPNQASADPPLKPFARLFRLMPSSTATSAKLVALLVSARG